MSFELLDFKDINLIVQWIKRKYLRENILLLY